jgi:ankyrin repeat protein
VDDELEALVIRAARTGDATALSGLVATHGADSVRMEGNPDDLTTLHWVAASGSRDAVEYLLSSAVGADPRAARNNSFTPLHSAAMQGHDEICELLLEAGADVNAQTDPQKYAPLHSAAFGGHVDVISALLAAGASRDLRNYRGERPDETARRQHQTAAATLLEDD